MDKPEVKVIGEDGNIFGIIAKAQRALREQGSKQVADELFTKVNKEAQSYDHALRIISEYVELT